MKIEFPVNENSSKKLIADHIYLVKDRDDDYGYLFYDNNNRDDYLTICAINKGLMARISLDNLTIIKDVTDCITIRCE